ncbi:hypothetical protein BOX17_11685 [Halomonas aestuarii]|uniref:Uncharacterized protein n=1 Tax=Halomonas aestuarii TaxID=1897729 RepID=A0A1J0VHR6_9GAMM|nr:hypothetical protein [Halomonas aestuarii]APE31549.1 hypothetical protein BOX17_11685 [Halomonas aestuarii]
MSRYSLNIARIGRGSGASEGEHDLVNVLVDGHLRRGLASASLAPEGHDGRPHCCTVKVPPCDLVDRAPLARFADHNHLTTREGLRFYTFATRVEALAFLRSLYGIDAPQPEPVDAITVSPRSVPAPSARNVVPSPVPAPIGTAYRAAFYGTAVTPHLFKRNTQ